jgi:two-component system phosphate regulon sensor histidine kinase PhoR
MQKLFGQVSEASVGAEGIDITKAELLGKEEIQQVIDDFAISRPQAVINFKADTAATIYIDRFHLATILNNLLDNAVKYGADVIDVSLEQNISTSGLRIKDNGRGIAPKDQQAVFEKFYRVEKGNIHNTKGLGLGLFYVKQIVTAYNGEITVKSEEQKGSIFTIVLPIA